MQELDAERIEEFGFTAPQLKELLSNYRDSLWVDFEQILALSQNDPSQELVSMLHSFKGMVSLFAKPTLVDWVVRSEQAAQSSLQLGDASLVDHLEGLKAKIAQLHTEVQMYLDTLQ